MAYVHKMELQTDWRMMLYSASEPRSPMTGSHTIIGSTSKQTARRAHMAPQLNRFEAASLLLLFISILWAGSASGQELYVVFGDDKFSLAVGTIYHYSAFRFFVSSS
jgi:hypothetical protein